MSTRYILLFAIVPIALITIGACLLWVTSNSEAAAKWQESKYPAINALGKTLDKAANIPENSTSSASALTRIIVLSGQETRANIQLLKKLTNLLFVLAVAQVILIISIVRKSRSSKEESSQQL